MDENVFCVATAAKAMGVNSKAIYQYITSIESKMEFVVYEMYAPITGKRKKRKYTEKGKILVQFAYEVVDLCNRLEVELYYSDEGRKCIE